MKKGNKVYSLLGTEYFIEHVLPDLHGKPRALLCKQDTFQCKVVFLEDYYLTAEEAKAEVDRQREDLPLWIKILKSAIIWIKEEGRKKDHRRKPMLDALREEVKKQEPYHEVV